MNIKIKVKYINQEKYKTWIIVILITAIQFYMLCVKIKIKPAGILNYFDAQQSGNVSGLQ